LTPSSFLEERNPPRENTINFKKGTKPTSKLILGRVVVCPYTVSRDTKIPAAPVPDDRRPKTMTDSGDGVTTGAQKVHKHHRIHHLNENH
jgi:hypothetical protein